MPNVLQPTPPASTPLPDPSWSLDGGVGAWLVCTWVTGSQARCPAQGPLPQPGGMPGYAVSRPLHIRCFLRILPNMLKTTPSNRWACLAGAEGQAGFRVQGAARTAERDQPAMQRKPAGNEMRLRASLGTLQPTDALSNRLVRHLNTAAPRQSQLDVVLAMPGAAVARAASCPGACHCRAAAVRSLAHVR